MQDGSNKKLLTLAATNTARAKAALFSAENHQGVRARAKRAILEELNSQLQVHAQKLRLHARNEDAQDSEYTGSGLNTSAQGLGVEAFQVCAMPSPSRIPRPVSQDALLLSPARQRRRTRQKAQVSTARKTHLVQNYNPSYTWNRGGRLKELRIRFLARKFFLLWQKTVFGRVLPSTAAAHYGFRIAQKAFSAWYEMWWEARKEWRLSVRAELHNRYRLWNTVWKAWKEYTLRHKVKTAKKNLAISHAKECLLHQAWTSWRLHVESRKSKHAVYAEASEVHDTKLLKRAWSMWLHQHDLHQYTQGQDRMALQFWANRLTTAAFLRWKQQFEQKQHEAEQVQRAALRYVRSLQQRCLAALHHHVQLRQHKYQLYAYARKVRRHQVLSHFFELWCQRHAMAQALRDHHETIEAMATRVHCRRLLVHWKYYVSLRHEKREAEHVARQHYDNKLKATTIALLKLNVVQGHLKAARDQMAIQFRSQKLLQTAWSRWQHSLEEHEEIDLLPQRASAAYHCKSVLLHKTWHQWTLYVQWRKHRKTKYLKADTHYALRILPQCLSRWHLYVEISQTKRELAEQAVQFRRENLQARFYYTWSTAYEASRDYRLAQRMAILHYDSSLTKRIFVLWRDKTQAALQEAFNWDVACEHHQVALCRQALVQWKAHVEECRQSYQRDQKAARHYYTQRVGEVWAAWMQYVAQRRHKRSQLALAERHYQQHVLDRTFASWKAYHVRWREILLFAEARKQDKDILVLRHCLHIWHGNAAQQKAEASQEQLAVHHHDCHLTQVAFSRWRHYAMLKARKRYHLDLELAEARQALDRGVLQRSFQHWQRAKLVSVQGRQRWQRAVTHHQGVLAKRAWLAWKEHTHLQLRKQLLQRQCIWFHNTRLTARFFLHWQMAYTQERWVRQRTALALWHWSLVLQNKVLVAWCAYVHDRRRKKARHALALEQRRMHLLRAGASQWLTVATDLQAVRQRCAIQQGAQKYYQLQQTVQRCAFHWREKTAQRKAAGLETRPRARPIKLEVSANKTRVNTVEPGMIAARTEPTIFRPKALESSTVSRLPAVLHMDPLAVVPPVPSVSPARYRPHSEATMLEERCRTQAARPPPRRPDFLIESLKREGLYLSPVKVSTVALPTQIEAPATAVASSSLVREQQLEASVSKKKSTNDNASGMEPSADPSAESEPRAPLPPMTQLTSTLTPINQVEPLDDVNFLPTSDSEQSFVGLPAKSKAVKFANSSVQTGSSISEMPQKPQKLELLPPTAFMVHRDGTPIVQKESKEPPVFALDSQSDSPAPNGPAHEVGMLNNSETSQNGLEFLSPADEMVHIRKTLVEFKKCKQRLKLAYRQERHLISWLAQQGTDDPDVAEVQQELHLLKDEIAELSSSVQSQKGRMQRLARRAQQLVLPPGE